ncbi:hypothetical protein KJ877_06865 [bacterium]|nr:hypothetical protein [bacterium]MBU1991364.1 hypothetical protein [bacterium]
MYELSYKDEIEALKDEPDFEALGDERYLRHEDDEARLEWAFYRPSGSHPKQVSDKNAIVAIMAFNHSRLGALERYKLLNPDVVKDDFLRNKIRNRSRMLFRAMIDDDFVELLGVLNLYPVFFDLAYDQMIHGRIWNEVYANPVSASDFLTLAGERADEKLIIGLKRRLQPLEDLSVDACKSYMDLLESQVQKLHTVVKMHYADEFEKWIAATALHPLQKILWQKRINSLRERSHD